MTDRYESRVTTHADNCWSWGPAHYGCAVREIERLRAEVERYRPLLRKGVIEDVAVVATYAEEIDGDDLDAAIDAAKQQVERND